MKKLSVILTIMLLSLSTNFGGSAPSKVNARQLKKGDEIPNITGTTIDGKLFDLEQLRGKIILVDFWATWCGPCVAETPNIQKAQQQYKDKDFVVLGISLDKTADLARNYMKKNNLDCIMLCDEKEFSGPNAKNFSINAIPTVLLLDRDLKVYNANARGKSLHESLEQLFIDPKILEAYKSKIYKLKTALKLKDETSSLAVAETLTESDYLIADDLENIAYKNCFSDKPHYKTVIALAEKAWQLSGRSSIANRCQIAKATAQLKLGNLDAAEKTFKSAKAMQMNRKDINIDIGLTEIHIARNKKEEAWDSLGKLLAQNARYKTIVRLHEKTAALGQPDDTILASWAKRWLDSYESALQTRLKYREVQKRDGLYLVADYDANNSPLKKSKAIFLYIGPPDTRLPAAPMKTVKSGFYTRSYKIPDDADELVIYLGNTKGKIDDNMGENWKHTVQDLTSAEVDAD